MDYQHACLGSDNGSMEQKLKLRSMKEYLLTKAEKESHSLLIEHRFFPAVNPAESWLGKEKKSRNKAKAELQKDINEISVNPGL